MPGKLWIGTSSWTDRALVASGRFYPDDVKHTPARLAYYAERFNLGEVDSTYYALPSRKNIERWADAVPDGFRFIVKAFALHTQHPTQTKSIPKSFHDALPADARNKARVYAKDVPVEVSDELWRIFLAALRPMRDSGKLGAVLIDFPPWFVPSNANREYLIQARERVPDDPVIVEFRNRLWVSDEESVAMTFDLLRELGCGFVCVDEPPGLDSSFPPVAGVTAPTAAVRLRGRNAERWEDRKARTDEKLNWWYTEEELSEWVPRIQQLAAEAEDVYITFNTKAEDQSVVNAAKLKGLLGLK